MPSVLNAPYFQDEEAAYAKLESIVWPHGPVCPHCGVMEKMKRMGGAATRPGLYKCYACRKQSRVTVGTVFESSHIKLHVWLQAVFLICSSKKGISSNQLARVLGLTVKSAWFMSHRIREAMATGTLPPMGGEGKVVEIDETFIGNKKGVAVKRGYRHKNVVLTLVERGGSARSFHVDGVSAKDLLPIKRGMKWIYQLCSERHLHRYVAEFDFRYSNRMKLGVDDKARTKNALTGIVGKRLMYKDSLRA